MGKSIAAFWICHGGCNCELMTALIMAQGLFNIEHVTDGKVGRYFL